MMEHPGVLKLIKGVEVYAPEYLGRKDVLIASDKVAALQEHIESPRDLDVEVINGGGRSMVPGFIDCHVHILGGGGEGGYGTRTPEIMLSDITRAGVTTVVGCLGTDGTTRTMSSLIAKARALEEEGITCYVCTGSYEVPVRTLTGSIRDDIILIDKIIGVGEIALSDHRSSQPTVQEVMKIAAAARVGGMLSGKAGVVNVHVGGGKRRLAYLEQIAAETEIPITQFIPTHVQRTPELLEAAIDYALKGGLVDLTTSVSEPFVNQGGLTCGSALRRMLEKGVPIENISFSSDGQGSLPVFDEKGRLVALDVGRVMSLFEAFRGAVVQEKLPMQGALAVVSANPARNLKLENKGRIQVGSDADLLLLDKDLDIHMVMAKGRIMVKDKEVMVKGTFEK